MAGEKLLFAGQNRLNPYTLKGIIRDAGLTDKEFQKLL